MPTTYLTLTTYPTLSSLSVCELPLAATPSAPSLNLQVHERFLFRTVPHRNMKKELKLFLRVPLSKGINLNSFIAFYSANKDLSMTWNCFFIIVVKVKQSLSLSSFPSNNFFCFSVIPAPTNHQWRFYICDITFLWLQSWCNNESSLFEHF